MENIINTLSWKTFSLTNSFYVALPLTSALFTFVSVMIRAGKRVHVQSAYALPTEQKQINELRGFALTADAFPKIIARQGIGNRWFDDHGVLHLNLIDFLLDQDVL